MGTVAQVIEYSVTLVVLKMPEVQKTLCTFISAHFITLVVKRLAVSDLLDVGWTFFRANSEPIENEFVIDIIEDVFR